MSFWPTAIAFVSSLFLAAGSAGQGRAAAGHSFIISATEGYGLEDCLGEGGDCGRVVADAWCEAHGQGAAISLGRAEDVTGAIILARSSAPPQVPYFITCSE
jgi:hypothetical protein